MYFKMLYKVGALGDMPQIALLSESQLLPKYRSGIYFLRDVPALLVSFHDMLFSYRMSRCLLM